jgi:hypothetical protein
MMMASAVAAAVAGRALLVIVLAAATTFARTFRAAALVPVVVPAVVSAMRTVSATASGSVVIFSTATTTTTTITITITITITNIINYVPATAARGHVVAHVRVDVDNVSRVANDFLVLPGISAGTRRYCCCRCRCCVLPFNVRSLNGTCDSLRCEAGFTAADRLLRHQLGYFLLL